MPLLNYTTEIAAAKSVGEIQGMLIQAKAQSILTEFHPTSQRLLSVSFRIASPFGILSIRMPANVEAVYKTLCQEKIPQSRKTYEQAERVAWRIQKDWLEAQLAIVRVKMAELQQVFLPYIQDPETGQTVYEKLHEKKFAGLALPAQSQATTP